LNATRAFLSARLIHNESVLFVAMDDNIPVGFAQLYPSFSSVSLARTYILNDLYVQQDNRRKGIGSSLLAAVAEYAKSVGAVRLTLSTAVNNKMAQALYKASGWQRDDQFMVYHLPLN
jgi:GNAT superfamily N-acetyltransferase